MDNLDRALLSDLIHFTHMNHIATVYMLRKTLNPSTNGVSALEDAAIFALSKLRHYPSAEAVLDDVRKYNDAKRMERIVSARIFAELISALEDLGALGDAIQHRQGKGIFCRYVTSSTGQAAAFFDHVLQKDTQSYPNATLEDLLILPSLASLHGQLTDDLLETFAQSYHSQAQNLRVAAGIYRHRDASPTRLSLSNPAPTDWEEYLNVLLDAGTTTTSSNKSAKTPSAASMGPGPQSGGVYARVFNKLKHRFMLTERLPDYAPADLAEYVEYKPLPATPEFVDRVFEDTIAVAGTTAELAALLKHLDDAGIAL